MAEALKEVEKPGTHDLWLFDVCSVQVGHLQGMQFVAIGSNAEKRKRAGNLALALIAAASRSQPVASEAGNHRFLGMVQALRPWMPQDDGSDSVVPAGPAVHSQISQAPPPGELASAANLASPYLPEPPPSVTARQAPAQFSGAHVREASVDSDYEVVLYKPQKPQQVNDVSLAAACLSCDSNVEITDEPIDSAVSQPTSLCDHPFLGPREANVQQDVRQDVRQDVTMKW